jgi:CysZ protein
VNGPYAQSYAGAPLPRRQGGFRDLVMGVGYLARGLGWVARHPAQWLFGLIPALIVLVVYAAGLVGLGLYVDDVARWVTPFAGHWSPGLRQTIRVVAALAILGSAAFLAVVTFTAITLVVGEPFYESLAVRAENDHGGAPPEPNVSLFEQIVRGVGDALVMGLYAALFGVLFFALGFVPVIGQTVVPVLAACVTGYFLTGELTALALERRGLRRRDRFRLLKAHRLLAVGFGAATVALFLIPLGAVVAMPGAVVGGTLLARERLAPPVATSPGGPAGDVGR